MNEIMAKAIARTESEAARHEAMAAEGQADAEMCRNIAAHLRHRAAGLHAIVAVEEFWKGRRVVAENRRNFQPVFESTEWVPPQNWQRVVESFAS